MSCGPYECMRREAEQWSQFGPQPKFELFLSHVMIVSAVERLSDAPNFRPKNRPRVICKRRRINTALKDILRHLCNNDGRFKAVVIRYDADRLKSATARALFSWMPRFSPSAMAYVLTAAKIHERLLVRRTVKY